MISKMRMTYCNKFTWENVTRRYHPLTEATATLRIHYRGYCIRVVWQQFRCTVYYRLALLPFFSNYETSVKSYQEKLNEKVAKIKELEDAMEESRLDEHDCVKIEEVTIH